MNQPYGVRDSGIRGSSIIGNDDPLTGQVENKKIKFESTVVYTAFQNPLPYGPAVDNCRGETAEDKAHWEKYLSMLPELLTSGNLKPNKVRELGGINDILTGFKKQQEGKVSAERLVYKITGEAKSPVSTL